MIPAGPMVKSPLARCAAPPVERGRTTGDDMARRNNAPKVGVVMGSASDWEIMQQAVAQLVAFGVPHEAKFLPAPRTPEKTMASAKTALPNGLACITPGAGG